MNKCNLLFGNSEIMQQLYKQIESVAQLDATALIMGESGTGKELVARAIHNHSPRSAKPFIAVNCGAIAENLLESELFGHEKGSFTGALHTRAGYFEHVADGTLFLDEITEMSLAHQVKLLRVLETGKFFRVGGSQEIISQARIVAATNRDPLKAVKANHLREDLMYRLAVFPLQIPPLRERNHDCEQLAQLFLDELNQTNRTHKRLSEKALKLCSAYHWPGNIRELKNMIHRAFIMAENMVELPIKTLPENKFFNKDNLVGGFEKNKPQFTISIGTKLSDAQRNIIINTIKNCDGNKQLAAKKLEISLKKLNEYEVTKLN